MEQPTADSARLVTSSSAGSVGGTLQQTQASGQTVGTESTPQPEVRRGPSTRPVEIGKDFEICCAHSIPNHPGKCRRSHGHNYKIEVYMDGYINPETGMVEDFDYLDKIVRSEIVNIFDHQNLNDFFSLPTAENLAKDWMDRLYSHDRRFCRVVVWETSKCRAIAYR